jgi:hypothetical protein
MKKLFLRITMLIAICWVCHANYHLLGSATLAIRKTRQEVGEKIQMQQIATYVRMDFIDSQRIPAYPAALVVEYLRADGRVVSSSTGKDQWGTYYRCVPTDAGFRVESAGPDRYWGTADDLYFHQSLAGTGYQGPASLKRPGEGGSRTRRDSRSGRGW